METGPGEFIVKPYAASFFFLWSAWVPRNTSRLILAIGNTLRGDNLTLIREKQGKDNTKEIRKVSSKSQAG